MLVTISLIAELLLMTQHLDWMDSSRSKATRTCGFYLTPLALVTFFFSLLSEIKYRQFSLQQPLRWFFTIYDNHHTLLSALCLFAQLYGCIYSVIGVWLNTAEQVLLAYGLSHIIRAPQNTNKQHAVSSANTGKQDFPIFLRYIQAVLSYRQYMSLPSPIAVSRLRIQTTSPDISVHRCQRSRVTSLSKNEV